MKGKRLLCLFIIWCLLLIPFHGVAAEAVPSWVEERNLARYRGTAITEAERTYYSEVTTCVAKSVTILAEEITAGLTTDVARLQAIYDWVGANITYDSAHVARTICSCMQVDLSEDALRQKKSNARGLTELTEQLCRAADIPAQAVYGWRLEPGESWGRTQQSLSTATGSNHWWNEAYVDGRWLIFDRVDGRFDLPFATFTKTYLKATYISDGTYLYFQDFPKNSDTLQLRRLMDTTLTEAIVPTEVQGLSVNRVANSAFEGRSALTRITLPAAVTQVGANAFAGTGIEEAPDLSAVETVSDGLFTGCTNLKTFTFPAQWTKVGREMFKGCTSLEEVTLSEKVTTIGVGAFEDCTALRSVNLPAAVTQIENAAFKNCTALTALSSLPNLKMVGPQAFAGSGITAIHLPDKVTGLGNWVFSDCQNLKEVTLSAGLTTIPWGTFRNCAALETVNIPAGVTSIEREAFEGCTSLATLNLPEGLVSLVDRALADTGLTSLTLPATLTTIGKEALDGLSKLEQVQVAEGNETYFVRNGALFLDTPRTLLLYPAARPNTSYTIPSDVRKIGDRAFAGAVHLQTLRISVAMTTTENWGVETFRDCTALQKIDFATGTKYLPHKGFVGCTSLSEVELPDALRSLSLTDFAGCTQLESIRLPAKVDYFVRASKEQLPALQGVYADPDNRIFGDIDGVLYVKPDNYLYWYPPARTATSYEVPAGLIAIGSSCFENATALTSITLPEGIEEIRREAFRGTSVTSLDLPKSLVILDATALVDTPWWEAQEAGPLYCDDAFCGVKGTFREKELTIKEGTRLMAFGGLDECKDLKRLTIPASVTAIWLDEAPPQSLVSILGQRGSVAEAYAKQHNRLFADPAEMILGDVDGDGAYTTTDARLALQYVVKKADKYDLFLDMADVDGDGAYTTTDARLMLQYAVGKIKEFPVPKT